MAPLPPLTGLAICGALLAAACQGPPPEAPVRRQLRQTQQAAELAPCRGGLLCEDVEPLGGFRVPLGCNPTYIGRYTKICSVSGIRPVGRLTEFLASRYTVTQDGESWLVAQPGVGQLRVFLRGEVAEFVAMPADVTLTN